MLQNIEIDYEGLLHFWACTGLHIDDFIIGLDLSAESTDIAHNINLFPDKLRKIIKETSDCPPEWRQTLRAKKLGITAAGDIKFDFFKRKTKSNIPPPSFIEECKMLAISPEEKRLELTNKILHWRETQAIADWQLAEKLRRHISNLLGMAIGGEAHVGPQAIKQLASAMVDLQKVQRLALGLSSENIGFPMKGISQGGEQLPICNLIIEADVKK